MYNFTEPIPIKESYYDNNRVGWWDFLKSLWRKHKLAKLNDDIQTQYNTAIAIRIVQADGGCKLDEFPHLGITNTTDSN